MSRLLSHDRVERPTDIRRLLGHMLGASTAAPKIDPERIGFFGFSRGGYTGLVLIGANPDWAKVSELRQQSSLHVCEQIRRKEFPAQPLAHDPRIRAAVVADPLGGFFFTAESLSAVKTPVQLWASELGGDGITQESVAAVNQNLPAKHEYHLVPNSVHFAFIICPPALAKAVPEICTDAPASTASSSTSNSMLKYSPSFGPSSGRHAANNADLARPVVRRWSAEVSFGSCASV